jgi:hypothetical protein
LRELPSSWERAVWEKDGADGMPGMRFAGAWMTMRRNVQESVVPSSSSPTKQPQQASEAAMFGSSESAVVVGVTVAKKSLNGSCQPRIGISRRDYWHYRMVDVLNYLPSPVIGNF